MSGTIATAGSLPVMPDTSPNGAAPADAMWSAAMDQASQANQATQSSQPGQPPPQAAPANTQGAAGQNATSSSRHPAKKSSSGADEPHEKASSVAPRGRNRRGPRTSRGIGMSMNMSRRP
jgi:hypothetical protein